MGRCAAGLPVINGQRAGTARAGGGVAPLAQHTRLLGNGVQLTIKRCVADIRTVYYGATQFYLLGGTAAALVPHLVECAYKKELFTGAQAKQITLTNLPMCLHFLALPVRMRPVSLSMAIFRSLSSQAPAEGASAAAEGAEASSSQDEASDWKEASPSPGRNARPSAVLRATRSVLDALSSVVRTYDCCFLGLLGQERGRWRSVAHQGPDAARAEGPAHQPVRRAPRQDLFVGDGAGIACDWALSAA